MSSEQANLEEHHIHGFLGYFTVEATIFTIGSTIALLIGQYERAGRALSTRQGVHRRRLVQIFLGLALACFVVITTLKYANPVARAEVGNTLAGAPSGSTANLHETRATEDGYVVANGDEVRKEQKETSSRWLVSQLILRLALTNIQHEWPALYHRGTSNVAIRSAAQAIPSGLWTFFRHQRGADKKAAAIL